MLKFKFLGVQPTSLVTGVMQINYVCPTWHRLRLMLSSHVIAPTFGWPCHCLRHWWLSHGATMDPFPTICQLWPLEHLPHIGERDRTNKPHSRHHGSSLSMCSILYMCVRASCRINLATGCRPLPSDSKIVQILSLLCRSTIVVRLNNDYNWMDESLLFLIAVDVAHHSH